MRTLNQLVADLQTICTDHKQVRGFHYGPLDEADIGKLNVTSFPLVECRATAASVDRGSIIYEVDIAVADMVLEDYGNRTEVLSDTLLILTDIINHFAKADSNSSEITGNGYTVQTPVTCDAFTARFDNELSGWGGKLLIVTDFDTNLCDSP